MDICYWYLKGEKIIGLFYENELQKTNQQKSNQKKMKQAACQMERIR